MYMESYACRRNSLLTEAVEEVDSDVSPTKVTIFTVDNVISKPTVLEQVIKTLLSRITPFLKRRANVLPSN